MSESIVAVRLTRNLRYKLTYVKLFETYLESASAPEMIELLHTLVQSQQAAIASLAGYLRRMGLYTQDLELNDKLLTQAAGRTDMKAQMRFVYDGLQRAAEWYLTQLADKQMTQDPELRHLLVELGEAEASKLWRTEAVMAILRIPAKALKEKEQEPDVEVVPEPMNIDSWRPRLVDDFGRPSWAGGEKPQRRPPPTGRPRRRDR
jgi:hypothetical protein